MGLFGDGEKCVFCGKESGFLGGLMGTTLLSGEFMCSECRDKCAPGNFDFGKMRADAVRANMAAAEANRKKGKDQFRATRKFQAGRDKDNLIIVADDTHGWFMDAYKDDGWVYDVNDIYYFALNLEFEKAENRDAFTINYEDYPELPKCPEGMKISKATLVLSLLKNELGVDTLEFDLLPPFTPHMDDYRAAYDFAHSFHKFMRDYRNGQKSKIRR